MSLCLALSRQGMWCPGASTSVHPSPAPGWLGVPLAQAGMAVNYSGCVHLLALPALVLTRLWAGCCVPLEELGCSSPSESSHLIPGTRAVSGHGEGREGQDCPSSRDCSSAAPLGVGLSYAERGFPGSTGSEEQACSQSFLSSDLATARPQDESVQLADLRLALFWRWISLSDQ